MLELAVAGSVRHEDTAYDQVPMAGIDRVDARDRVQGDVRRVIDEWRRA